MNKKKVFFLILLLMILFFYYFLLNNRKKNEIKHVYLITIDTLRADHLSCYGYPVETTPFIDSLAKNGVIFENAFSQSATTCPSHASIMTGLYPSQHRVLANGYILDDSYTTLAEILKANGFKTAAFTSTDRHFLASNINQGFDMYEEPLDTIKTYGFKYRQARLTINNAILWLDNFDSDKKLFMWIHLFDPHMPYHPPKKFKKLIRKQLKKDYLKKYVQKAKVNLEIFDNSFDKYYEHILNYDSEIRYVDEELKRFFNILKDKKLFDNSLIIITGDHGEALGQHNWLQHATFIYQEEIHVPLIFCFINETTGDKIKRRKLTESVGNFDIFSSVLEFTRINHKKKYLSKVESVSLKDKIFNGKRIGKKVFTERQYYKKKKKYKKDRPFWRRVYEKGIKVSLQDNTYKYIYRSDFPDELYNLKDDSFESSNIAKEKNKIASKYKKEILRILSNFKNKQVKKTSKKIFKRLKSLGYVE
jgi:arylsulfatase A-like enzyme